MKYVAFLCKGIILHLWKEQNTLKHCGTNWECLDLVQSCESLWKTNLVQTKINNWNFCVKVFYKIRNISKGIGTSTLLNWPIVSLLILFILFSMFFVLIHYYTLYFTGSPCYNLSHYNYISIWPYYIVIHLIETRIGAGLKCLSISWPLAWQSTWRLKLHWL